MFDDNYYCLSSDGSLYALGNHGDWEAAEATAQDMGFDPIWVFGRDSFTEWRKTLNNFYMKGE